MALVGKRDGSHFGYGWQLCYAGSQALKDLLGGEHYGTVKAHSDRWQAFTHWCRSKGPFPFVWYCTVRNNYLGTPSGEPFRFWIASSWFPPRSFPISISRLSADVLGCGSVPP